MHLFFNFIFYKTFTLKVRSIQNLKTVTMVQEKNWWGLRNGERCVDLSSTFQSNFFQMVELIRKLFVDSAQLFFFSCHLSDFLAKSGVLTPLVMFVFFLVKSN